MADHEGSHLHLNVVPEVTAGTKKAYIISTLFSAHTQIWFGLLYLAIWTQ